MEGGEGGEGAARAAGGARERGNGGDVVAAAAAEAAAALEALRAALLATPHALNRSLDHARAAMLDDAVHEGAAGWLSAARVASRLHAALSVAVGRVQRCATACYVGRWVPPPALQLTREPLGPPEIHRIDHPVMVNRRWRLSGTRQQSVASRQTARGWARPPCRHLNIQLLAAALGLLSRGRLNPSPWLAGGTC